MHDLEALKLLDFIASSAGANARIMSSNPFELQSTSNSITANANIITQQQINIGKAKLCHQNNLDILTPVKSAAEIALAKTAKVRAIQTTAKSIAAVWPPTVFAANGDQLGKATIVIDISDPKSKTNVLYPSFNRLGSVA